MRTHHIALVLALFPLFVLGSCSDGGGGGDTISSDFLITDGPVDHLLAFEATVDALRLVRTDGVLTSNLLAGPVPTEFLGLQGSAAWLAHMEAPARVPSWCRKDRIPLVVHPAESPVHHR